MHPENMPGQSAETQPQSGTLDPVASGQVASLVQPTALQRKHGVVCLILARLLDPVLHLILDETFWGRISEKLHKYFSKTSEPKEFRYSAQTLKLEPEQIQDKNTHIVFIKNNRQPARVHLHVHSGYAKYVASAPHGSNFLDHESKKKDVHNSVDTLVGTMDVHAEVDAFMYELFTVVAETDSLVREAKVWEFVKRWIPDDPGPCPNIHWRDPSSKQRAAKALDLYYSYWVQHDPDTKLHHYRAPQHLAFYSLISLPTAEAAAATVHMLITLVPALLPSPTANIHLIREPVMRSVGLDLEFAAIDSGLQWSQALKNKLLNNTLNSVKVGKSKLRRRCRDQPLPGSEVLPGEAIKAGEVVTRAIERRECRLCFLDAQKKERLAP